MTDAKATKQRAGSAGERALAAQLHAAGVPFEQEQVLELQLEQVQELQLEQV